MKRKNNISYKLDGVVIDEIAFSNRYHCPCCGYLTLEERGAFEICYLCSWEDDGQDDSNADEVRGGPNGEYSLTEARDNFKMNDTMYNDDNIILSQSEKEKSTKKALMTEFEKLKAAGDHSVKTVWEKIYFLEEILAAIVYESTTRHSDNVEKNLL
ncbi:CPCC family cysteine-rich protein [Paenibacillus gorillae]|uniref:CPCC family cysteine-rich protein n=1 Tax=Paenibacillus gorillae TaxID=1243662 RepID=UPI000693B200|nr:CPCC family cysteine-rich protein [Paenibacillus gorillae]